MKYYICQNFSTVGLNISAAELSKFLVSHPDRLSVFMLVKEYYKAHIFLILRVEKF
jgi:hypothetical protein